MMGQDFLGLLILGLVIAVFISLAIVARKRERQRREALAVVADRLGFTFSAEKNEDISYRFRQFRGLDTGDNRYAYCVLQGNRQGRWITAFDFHYQVSSSNGKRGRSTRHYYLHVVVLQLDRAFPPLFIAPEGVLSKIAQAFGHDDIDFESHEFSRRFCVRGADRKFAYDFCNASMIDFLLDHPSLQLETREGVLAAVFDGTMLPQHIESEIDLVGSVRDRIPDYLFEAA